MHRHYTYEEILDLLEQGRLDALEGCEVCKSRLLEVYELEEILSTMEVQKAPYILELRMLAFMVWNRYKFYIILGLLISSLVSYVLLAFFLFSYTERIMNFLPYLVGFKNIIHPLFDILFMLASWIAFIFLVGRRLNYA